MSTRKRNDLQGVRGLAIIFVLLFHFFPKNFKNGFAGVDIFFVLSGYLMQLIYADRTCDLYSTLVFYRRRFIRLLPMFYLTVFATTVAGRLLLLESDFLFLQKEALWALGLATNVGALLELRGYFDAVTEFSYLLHTWSLALEMQFYLLAPLLFLLLRGSSRARLVLTLAVVAPSLCLHLVAERALSFEFLLSRVWQFQLGAISAMLSAQKLPFADKLHFVLSVLLVFFCLPSEWFPMLTEKFVRVFATLLATALFAVGAPASEERRTAFLCLRVFTYAGDVSYVMYLVHWPVIVFYRYINDVDDDLSLYEVLLLLAVIMTISVLLHEWVEKPLLSSNSFSLGVSVLFLLLTVTVLATNPSTALPSVDPVNASARGEFYWHASQTAINPNWSHAELIDNAIRKNIDWDHNGVHFLKPPKCFPNGYPPLGCAMPVRNGTIKAIVAGNSFTYRAFGVVYETIKNVYSELRMITESNCELFLGDFSQYENDPGVCGGLFRDIHNNVTVMNPDIVFLVSRYRDQFQSPIVNLTTDEWTANALKHLDKLAESTKKIVIAGPIHATKIWVSQRIARQLHFGKKVADMDYPYSEFLSEHNNTIARLQYITSRCPKCVYYDMQAPFCDESGMCFAYDKETFLAYTSDGSHISYLGNELLYPSLKILVDGLVEELESELYRSIYS